MNGFFVDQMAMYSAYHRHPRNRATHFIGIPAIAFAILVPMAWGELFQVGGATVTVAAVFMLAVFLLYLWLDPVLGIATTAFYLPVWLLAEWVAGLETSIGWTVFALFFAGGWAFQLIGHAIEGRRPALLDNLFQIFVAPVFLMAEVFFALGLKREMHDEMEARWIRYRPGLHPAGGRAAGGPAEPAGQ